MSITITGADADPGPLSEKVVSGVTLAPEPSSIQAMVVLGFKSPADLGAVERRM